MKDYKTVKISLEPKQMRALAGGRVVTLKSAMVGNGVSVTIGPVKHKQLMKALNSNKGYRLRLTEDEKNQSLTHGGALKDYLTKKRVRKVVDTGIKLAKPMVKKAIKEAVKGTVGEAGAEAIADASSALAEDAVNAVGRKTGAYGLKKKPKKGGDIKSVGRKIKRGFQKAVETYKRDIKPVISPYFRDGLTKAIQIGAPALVTSLGAPELAPVAGVLANQYARQGVDYLGDKTQAFGLKYGRGYEDEQPFGLMSRPYVVESNFSNFLSKQHPAQHPALPMGDFSRPRYNDADTRGTKPKYIFGRGEAPKGSPMNPVKPARDHSLHNLYYTDGPILNMRVGRNTSGGSFRTAGGSFMP